MLHQIRTLLINAPDEHGTHLPSHVEILPMPLVSGGEPSSCRVTGIRDELMLEASGTGETSAPRPNLGQSDATAASGGPEGQLAFDEPLVESLDASVLTRSAGATPHPRKQAAPPGETMFHRYVAFPEISIWKTDTHPD